MDSTTGTLNPIQVICPGLFFLFDSNTCWRIVYELDGKGQEERLRRELGFDCDGAGRVNKDRVRLFRQSWGSDRNVGGMLGGPLYTFIHDTHSCVISAF
jgi:hypothetical protein